MVTVVFRVALAFASLAVATAMVPNSSAIALSLQETAPLLAPSSPSVPWYMVSPSSLEGRPSSASRAKSKANTPQQGSDYPPLPSYLTGDAPPPGRKPPPPSRSPLFRLELDASTGGYVWKVQQAPPWAMAKGVSHSLVGGGSLPGAPDTWSIILPPDPEGLSGWILKATPQEFAVASLAIGVSIGLAVWASWAWRRARRGKLTTPKRLMLLLARLSYRRAVLFLWLVLIAGTTLWAPFKYVSRTGHALGPAPRQSLVLAKNEDEDHLVALDFQRLFAQWVGISAAGGALLVLTRARR